MKTDISFIGGRGVLSNYGGVENAIREITFELTKRNLKIDVYGVSDMDIEGKRLPVNLNAVAIPKWIYKKFGQHGYILFCVLTVISIKRPRVVILFASGPSIFTPLLRLGGIKVITSLRAIDSSRDKWGKISRTILKLGEYCAWKFSNRFTVNSQEMVRVFKPKRHDVVYVPNGSKKAVLNDPEMLHRWGVESGNYFLFAARFDPVKRLHKLLEAHALLDDKTRIPLVVAGGHSKDPEYEKKIKTLANSKVRFTGHLSQDELEPLMYHCRAFILPSVLEGMSNSLLSAMASEKAVVAADVPENRDVIVGELDALFIADDVDDLAAKLEKLATDSDYCQDLGKRLRNVAITHYDWGNTANLFYRQAEPYLN